MVARMSISAPPNDAYALKPPCKTSVSPLVEIGSAALRKGCTHPIQSRARSCAPISTRNPYLGMPKTLNAEGKSDPPTPKATPTTILTNDTISGLRDEVGGSLGEGIRFSGGELPFAFYK